MDRRGFLRNTLATAVATALPARALQFEFADPSLVRDPGIYYVGPSNQFLSVITDAAGVSHHVWKDRAPDQPGNGLSWEFATTLDDALNRAQPGDSLYIEDTA